MLVGSRDRFRHLFEQPAGALAAAQVTPYQSVTSVPADAEEAAPPDPVEPPDLDLLGDQIAELSARIQAATYELLCHLREFDRHCGWEGFRSCAHWLNWRTGLDLGAAREKLRVAAALAELNHVSAAMACGVLSYSKVRAITRVADTANEARLLAVACGATAEQVERLVRAWRRADRAAETDAEQMRLASRSLSTRVDEDGMVVLRGRLTPEVGALLLRALEAALEQVPAADDDDAPTVAQRRADALGLVAESALAGKLDPGSPGDRFQVTVHVDPATLPAREPATATPDSWVALGGYPPRATHRSGRAELPHPAPWRTDSLRAGQSAHDSRCCKRVPGQEPSKRIPVPVSGMGTSTQPFPPQAFHLTAEATQRPRVAGHAVVGVVAPQLAIQLPVLVSHPPVSVPAAPLADSLQRSAEAILRRLAFDRPASGSALPP